MRRNWSQKELAPYQRKKYIQLDYSGRGKGIGKEVSPGDASHCLNLADGDAIAEAVLPKIYLPVAANMAVRYELWQRFNCRLIQEANGAAHGSFRPETERKDDAGHVFSFARESSLPLRSRYSEIPG